MGLSSTRICSGSSFSLSDSPPPRRRNLDVFPLEPRRVEALKLIAEAALKAELNPGNSADRNQVVVVKVTEAGDVKLLDFGLAKALKKESPTRGSSGGFTIS